MKTFALVPLALMFTASAAVTQFQSPQQPHDKSHELNDAILSVTAQAGFTAQRDTMLFANGLGVDIFLISSPDCAEPIRIIPINYRSIEFVYYVSTVLRPHLPQWEQTIQYGPYRWKSFSRYTMHAARLAQALRAKTNTGQYASLDAMVLLTNAPGCATPASIDWTAIWDRTRYSRPQGTKASAS